MMTAWNRSCCVLQSLSVAFNVFNALHKPLTFIIVCSCLSSANISMEAAASSSDGIGVVLALLDWLLSAFLGGATVSVGGTVVCV